MAVTVMVITIMKSVDAETKGITYEIFKRDIK